MKQRYCPIIELERTGLPKFQVAAELKLTLIPAIDDDGNKVKPSIIEANIIGISTDDVSKVVYDGVIGELGELLITHNDSNVENVVYLTTNDELIIKPSDDDAEMYSRSKEDNQTELGQYLIYGDDFNAVIHATVVDANDNPVPDAWVQIKRVFNEVYANKTDENGYVFLRGKDKQRYQVIIAKSGYNQIEINNWKFVEGEDVRFIYPLVPKDMLNGMLTDTDENMYVDTYNGGHADGE